MRSVFASTLFVSLAAAFPFMGQPEVPEEAAWVVPRQAGDTCPTRSDHTGAVPFNPQYPYLGADPAKNNRGTGNGGILVPTPGDVDHEFRAPGPNDIRGPCPGLNAAANYGFLSRDGIVTYNELVAAQQNMYNVGYELANLLATAGVGLDGDVITQRLSIGCEATARTALLPAPAQRQPGLNGHNKFEADASLTRGDYFLVNGDNFRFNSTLFRMMVETTGGAFSRQSLGLFREERYNQSRRDNGNFFFGPGSLLLYGAASFLYELFPGSSHPADTATQMAFFGAESDGNGGYTFTGREMVPSGWRNRVTPYNLREVGGEIGGMYRGNQVDFGVNTGYGKFVFFDENDMPSIDFDDVDNIQCALYQLAVGGVPSQLTGAAALPIEVISWSAGNLNPIFKNMGCPLFLQ